MIKINFNSNDDSYVDITAKVQERVLIKSLTTKRPYRPLEVVEAVNDLQEIYPNNNLRTILEDHVDVTITQTKD